MSEPRTFRYVHHADVEDWLNAGWTSHGPLPGRHGFWSCLLAWEGDGEPGEPRPRVDSVPNLVNVRRVGEARPTLQPTLASKALHQDGDDTCASHWVARFIARSRSIFNLVRGPWTRGATK